MPRYLVEVSFSGFLSAEVDAVNEDDALEAANDALDEQALDALANGTYQVHEVEA